MNKEIEMLVEMCILNKESYSPEELATFIGLKYKEGVYPYIKKLITQKMIQKSNRGEYELNKNNSHVLDVLFITKLFPNEAKLLFTIHTKKILQKFSIKPTLKTNELPYHNLKHIESIAKKTRIIYSVPEGKYKVYFIRSWEEPTKRLLNFFNISLQFDEEDFKNQMIKHFSAFTGKQNHLNDDKKEELAESNMKYYLEGKDLVLNKLRNASIPSLSVTNIITQEKMKRIENLFIIESKINDWKIRYVYNTDKIEGNPLTLQDVMTILTLGDYSVKKDKKAVLETVNSRTALNNIFDLNNELNEDFIKKLHLATQQGIDSSAGRYKKEENCIVDDSGSLVDNTTPARFVKERMDYLISWYNENKKKIHPFIIASVLHNQLVYIHPFEDGNGRVARLVFNFILIKNGFFPIIFYNDQKQKYYSLLRGAKSGDFSQFIHFCMELYREQLENF